jgi:tRNA A-37 threonylcarbamoyl transferase component Bud32
MPDITLTFLDENQTVSLPVSKLEFFKSGGEGRLYMFRHNGRRFLLKALPDNQEIFERMKLLRNVLTAKKTHIPASIWYGGLHVAQGFCPPELLNFRTASGVYLLAFNYINGKTLNEKLPGKPLATGNGDIQAAKKDFSIRLSIACKVADVLMEIQKSGIVHGDIFFDNFMLNDQDDVFAIDFSGYGLYNQLKGEWERKPVIAGKFDAFGLPKPFEMNESNEPTMYTDRWAGMLLIWWVLTGTNNPYWFLKRVDKIALLDLNTRVNKLDATWPPTFIEPLHTVQYHNPAYPYQRFQEFMTGVFGKDAAFCRLLHTTFIHGYDKPLNRPSFRNIRDALQTIKPQL